MGKVKYLAVLALFVGLPFVASRAQYSPPASVSQSTDVTGSISSAQILALNSVPVTVIAAPGANSVIIVESAVMEMISGTAYAGTGTLRLQWASGTTALPTSPVCASQFFTASGVNAFCSGSGPSNQTGFIAFANMVNNSIQFSMLTAQDTTGTGTITYWIRYRVISGL